jgi:hypothetical protein
MAIVPQGEFVGYPNKHHDFLIFSSSTRSPKQDEWHVKCAIEVDYSATHIFYKYKDDARDRLVKYPVLRFSDGHTSEYLTWIQKVFSLFDDY